MALPVGPAAPAETSSSAVVGSLSAFILKRAKAVHKKLQRITSYETQDKATLNADQVRAVASKPTLEAIYAELNAILAQTQQHEANARSQAEAELARLTDLVNANAQRADEANAQLSFLLQFLHLYSLFHHDSAVNAVTPQPDVPAALAATVTSADIHALNPVLYAFANAPLSGTAPDDSETALGIIKRVKESDSSEIVLSASSSASSIPAGITHARLAELVKALTAAPPIPTQFGALDSNDLDSEPTAPVAPSADADAAVVADDATPVPASSSDPAATAENDVVAQDSDQAPTFLNFDADKGFSLGSGPVPPSAGGRILFMQASEVEGETETEPEQIAEQLPNESTAPDTTTTPSAQASLPIPEPAETIEPEGGAVDGAPVAEDLPASQADAAAPETTIPPVLHDLVDEPQSSSAATMPTEPATPAEAAPVQPKKIDWASLDSDDDAAIQDEVLRSSVLSLVVGQEKAVESAPQVAPVAVEAEATRHVKQAGKNRAGQSASNTSASASGPNSSNGPKSGRGTGRTSDSAPAQASVAPLRKPEPIVDEDGFVLHTTKKTLRQQQLAAQQESQQQNRSGGSGRGGGGGGRGGGARMGRGGGGGTGAGGRKERREGSGSAEVKEGAVEGASNGHGRERSSGGGGAGRSGSGTGTGRGAGAASGTGAGGNSNGTAARGRGRGRPSNAGGRQGIANPAAASSAPAV